MPLWLTPQWLLGLTALAVPIAIHLWSRGRRRIVRVGSVRWMAPEESRRARRLRPTRLWLLLVRCLLLAAIVLALAEPRLQRPASGGDGEVWLLVHPEVVSRRESLEAHDSASYDELDRWLDERPRIRWLAAGLPSATSLSGAPPPSGEGAVWSLVREADARAPAGVPFRVVTPDRLASVAGRRPRLEREVEWRAVRDPEENRWIERAGFDASGALSVLMGRSSAAGTRFEVASADQVAVERSGEQAEVRLAGFDPVPEDDRLIVDRVPRRLAVRILHSAERATDVRYLEAGLASAAAALGLQLEAAVEEISRSGVDARQDDRQTELFFRLAEGDAEGWLLAAVEGGSTLVSDLPGKFERCGLADLPVASGAGPVRFDRCGPPSSTRAGTPVWSDRAGRVVLEAERLGDGSWLRLGSRFSPRWSGLVLHPAFPEWLAEVLEGARRDRLGSAARAESDRRGMGSPQIASARPAEERRERRPSTEVDPTLWLWALVAVLFGGERLLAGWRA